MSMKRIYISSTGPEDWRLRLASPERQWKRGYSARTLAYCWEEANGFPSEIASLLETSGESTLKDPELLLAIPEYKVPLKGHGKPSQNDVFVLAKNESNELITIVIEGKVSETFGPTVGQWSKPETKGKRLRLAGLKKRLGVEEIGEHIRYQLVHRTASSVIEAERFGAGFAVMIVHSFSDEKIGYDDFSEFLALFGVEASQDQLVFLSNVNGVSLYCGWANGNAKYLEF
jgi:hypothetical protein